MSEVIIRNATEKDCQDCFELSKVPELLSPTGDSVPVFWFQAILKEKQILIVAEENKKVVGFIMGERLAGNVAIAHLMTVAETHRGKGIGRKLMEAFDAECRKRKMIVTIAYGNKKSPKILKMLEKNGFYLGAEVIECVKFYGDRK